MYSHHPAVETVRGSAKVREPAVLPDHNFCICNVSCCFSLWFHLFLIGILFLSLSMCIVHLKLFLYNLDNLCHVNAIIQCQDIYPSYLLNKTNMHMQTQNVYAIFFHYRHLVDILAKISTRFWHFVLWRPHKNNLSTMTAYTKKGSSSAKMH